MILIHPPISKPGEPPAGIARLSGALSAFSIQHSVIDANLEGQLYLWGIDYQPENDRSGYAYQNRDVNLAALRSGSGFRGIDHYKRIVGELNLALHDSAGSGVSRLDMAEFRHAQLSPVDSQSLIYSAEHPEENPFYPYYKNILIPQLENSRSHIIGISVNYLSQALCSFALAGLIKRIFPHLQIIMGGGLITSWMSQYKLSGRFDGIIDKFVSGPGEQKLISLASKNGTKLFYKPDYSGLPMPKYLSPGPVLPFSASHGCYWQNCEFCPEKSEGGAFTPLKPLETVSQITELCSEMNPVLIHFLDNAISPALLSTLVKSSVPVPWYGYVRFIKELEDPDFCINLKRAGCEMLKLGLESGSQAVLDAMQKGIKLESASRILNNLKMAGIPTYIYVLFGTPTETETDAVMTLDFVKKHADCITFLNSAVFNLPVNSRETEDLEISTLPGGDLPLYTGFKHPKGWDRGPIRHFIDRTWKRDPVIAQILRRTPFTFTSNHAPFFVDG